MIAAHAERELDSTNAAFSGLRAGAAKMPCLYEPVAEHMKFLT